MVRILHAQLSQVWDISLISNFVVRMKKLFWDLRIATSLKMHPIFLQYSRSNLDPPLFPSLEPESVLPPPPTASPSLERRASSGSLNIPTTPYYASGTFGGGGIGQPLLLIPAISTYPLTAKLRDDLLSAIKAQQLEGPNEPNDLAQKGSYSVGNSDPKDVGVLLSDQSTKREQT